MSLAAKSVFLSLYEPSASAQALDAAADMAGLASGRHNGLSMKSGVFSSLCHMMPSSAATDLGHVATRLAAMYKTPMSRADLLSGHLPYRALPQQQAAAVSPSATPPESESARCGHPPGPTAH